MASILELELTEISDSEDKKKMASGLHGFIGSRMNYFLRAHVDEQGLGYVFDASATYDFNDGLPKREPDVSFVSTGKLSAPLDEDITVAPDIAVEVVSKNDKVFAVHAKVRQYQQAGVSLVWVLYPDVGTVDVYRLETGLRSDVLLPDDELDGGQVLPGFKLLIHKIFDVG